MRITILQALLAVAFMGIVNAREARTQELMDRRVSISARQEKIKSVFLKMEKQIGVKFLYSSNVVDPYRLVTLEADKMPLSGVLEQLLRPLQLTYEVSDRHIIINRIFIPLLERPSLPADRNASAVKSLRAITGRVKDETGQGLPGVSVLVKGTQRGTITDVNGSFSIATDEERDVLVFSFVGYLTEELAVDRDGTVELTMKVDNKSLKEVIVVGYGVQSKRNVTSSIASVSSEEIANQPVQQVGQALQGKVAGVQVVQNSGSPGASLTVRVRGAGTINNSDPLYVIDGNLGASPASVDPGQIETIEILKSASAAAIYGAQGANGVVIITTKKGRSGKPSIQLNAYTGFQKVHRMLSVVNARQYAELYNTALVNGGKEPLFKNVETLGAGTDWQREIYRSAPISNIELSAGGGGERGTFYVSGGYFSQDGIVLKSDYKRISFRINSEYRLAPKVRIGENISFASGKRNQIPEFGGRDIIPNSWYMDPTVPVKNDDGSWGFPRFSDTKNPVAQAFYNNNTAGEHLLNGSGYLVADFLDYFSFRTQLNLNIGYKKRIAYTPVFDVFPLQRNLINTLENTTEQSLNWDWQNTLNYQRDFGDHSLEVLAGITALNSRVESYYAQGQNLPPNADFDKNLRYMDLATSGFSARGGAGEYGMLSYLGRVNYDYKDRYLLTANLRVDGSSRFGRNNRYGTFPSVSAGWRISDEAFFKGITFLDDLKLRAGWGMLGNQNFPAYYAFANTLTPNLVYAFGSAISQGQAATSVGNPDLKWESIRETEFGLDFSAFRKKLSVSAAYYIKNTSNMLLRAPVPAFTGIQNAPFVNGGSLQNRGVELIATYSDRTQQGFSYEISGNISKNVNKVTGLANNQSMIFSETYSIASVGAPLGSFYGYVMDGIFQNQNEVDAHAYQAGGTGPGDIRFKDLNGDKVINQDDRAVIGSPWPNFNYGLSVNLSWKKFDLSSLFYGVSGSDIVANWKYFTQGSNFYNFDSEMLRAWNGEGSSNRLPRLNVNDPNNNFRASSYFVEKGDYLRLRNLQVGYAVLDGKGGSGCKLRVYLSCQNLFTITGYNGFDPEIGNPDPAAFRIGVDDGYYPQPRVITLGVNVGL
ncbi:TonB-dependent receptor [Ravibacter arvi]